MTGENTTLISQIQNFNDPGPITGRKGYTSKEKLTSITLNTERPKLRLEAEGAAFAAKRVEFEAEKNHDITTRFRASNIPIPDKLSAMSLPLLSLCVCGGGNSDKLQVVTLFAGRQLR